VDLAVVANTVYCILGFGTVTALDVDSAARAGTQDIDGTGSRCHHGLLANGFTLPR